MASGPRATVRGINGWTTRPSGTASRVVHVDHGIGQFEGLRQIESGGHRGEFMLLRYAEDARLYVPLERMDLVQSYRAAEGTHPPLDKLGGTAWNSRKTRA